MPEKLTDLATQDPELDCIILEEFPEELYAGQHAQEGTRKNRTYKFYDLDMGILEKFLKQRGYTPVVDGNIVRV